jgi:hypothetical protein
VRNIEKVLIGHIGVDAGLCWIGDPCYILHRDDDEGLPKTLGKNWSDFCKTLLDEESNPLSLKSYGFSDSNTEGLGVVVSTGYGDGFYPVYAKIDKDTNTILSATVVFVEQ